jgi:hypothetical protein
MKIEIDWEGVKAIAAAVVGCWVLLKLAGLLIGG